MAKPFGLTSTQVPPLPMMNAFASHWPQIHAAETPSMQQVHSPLFIPMFLQRLGNLVGGLVAGGSTLFVSVCIPASFAFE